MKKQNLLKRVGAPLCADRRRLRTTATPTLQPLTTLRQLTITNLQRIFLFIAILVMGGNNCVWAEEIVIGSLTNATYYNPDGNPANPINATYSVGGYFGSVVDNTSFTQSSATSFTTGHMKLATTSKLGTKLYDLSDQKDHVFFTVSANTSLRVYFYHKESTDQSVTIKLSNYTLSSNAEEASETKNEVSSATLSYIDFNIANAGTYAISNNSSKSIFIVALDITTTSGSSECEVTGISYTPTSGEAIQGTKSGNVWTVTIPYGDTGNTGDGNYNINFTISDGANSSITSPVKKSLTGASNSQGFTVTAEDGVTKKDWTITLVRGPKPVSNITLDKTSIYIPHDGQVQLTATVLPDDATNKNVNWSTGDGNIATVSNGLIKGKTVWGGKTIVTAIAADGNGASASCDVYVYRFSETGSYGREFNVGAATGNGNPVIYTVFPTNEGNITLDKNDFSLVSSDPDIISAIIYDIQEGNKIRYTLTVGNKPGNATLTLTYNGSNENYRGKTFVIPYTVKAVVGKDDCSEDWAADAKSKAVELTNGKTVTFSFVNRNNNSGEYYNNWNVLTGPSDQSIYDTQFRGDAWYTHNQGTNWALANQTGTWPNNKDDFQSKMNGANVTVKVTKLGNTIYYYAIMTLSDGSTVISSDMVHNYTTAPEYAWLRVDKSYITDLVVTTGDITYRTINTTKSGDGDTEGTVSVKVKDTNAIVANGGTVVDGTTVTFTAEPREWYMFDNWHDGTNYVGNNTTPYTTNITSNLNLKANFTRGYKVNLVANNAAYGNVAISGGNMNEAIKKGTNITLTATPNDGYSFVKWVVGSADKSTATSFSNKIENIISGVANDKEVVTITAVFEQDVTLTESDIRFNSTSQLATNNNRWTPKAGETLNLAEIIQTTSAGAKTYQSDNTVIATVSEAGVITAGSATGTATITVTQAADATYKQGMLTFTVDVIPNKNDASSNAYTVANDDKVSNGTQIIRKDITMTYGGDNFWGIGAQDSHGSYIASLTTPVVTSNVPSAGTYYKFRANKSGTLSVDIKGGQSKVLAVSKNGTLIGYKNLDGKDIAVGTKFSASYFGDVTFPVEAGTDYYMYCTNSKLAVYGFEFLPNATVTLNANGGTGSMAPLSVETGSDVAISHNTFTNSSSPYFTGWNTVANGSGTAYSDGDMIHVDGDITLYAQWSNKASRGVTLLSYTVNGAVTANTTYPADEGTVMFSKGSKLDGNGVYVKGMLPDGYKLQAGDKIIVTGSTGNGGDQGVFIANSTATPSTSNAVSNIKNISQDEKNKLVSLTYTVTEEDVTSGVLQNLNSFYVFKYDKSWTISSIKVIRDVNYSNPTTNPSDLSVTFDPASGSTLTNSKVKVLGNDKTDAMYIMWSSSATLTEADICKAENLHQINPVYVEQTLSGNVYLHVVPANYNAGNPTRGNVQTANYKVYVDPVLAVSDMTTSAQINPGLTPNYTVTYNNGVEDVTVTSPTVTFALKAGEATDVISISGNQIKGLKEGKVTVVASYAQNDALCLNAVTTEFTVNVDLHLYFKAEFENNVNYVTVDKGEESINLPTFTIKDAAGNTLTAGTDFTMSAYQLQEGSDAEIIDIEHKQVKTGRPGCAMVKITLTPIGSYSSTYETTNIYIPVMVEETDASKYYAVAKDETFKLLKSIERNGCTMTFGGWTGYYQDGKTLEGVANGNSGNATYGSVGYHSSDDKVETGGFTQDRWDNGSDISKQTISSLFQNVTSGSHNKNPRNETATNPYTGTNTSATHSYVRNDQALGGTSNASYDLFSVPCRGAYVKFEPKVDGIVTLHINQKTILEDQNHTFSNGRYFQVKDERGKFVTPRTYCSNTATIKTPRYADFKVGTSGRLDNAYLQEQIGNFQQEYELNQVLKIGSSVTEAPNFATLYECPVTYSFEVKAGKTYYAYCVVSKMDVAGFEFHTELSNPSNITNVTLNENGTINSAAPITDNVINQASITYNRSINAGNWNPIVLPYSMNEHQVKYVFGNGEASWRNSAEILYFDHIDNSTGTIFFMNHFYKTIIAGVPCLVRPTKNVTSLSLAGCEYPYVTIETPAPMVVSAGANGDGYNWSSAYAQQQIEIGDYYFSATSGIKQKTSGSASTLKGFRSVLKAPAPSQAKVYSVKVMSFDEEEESKVTGIPYIIVDEEGNMSIPQPNNIYNMNGQIVRAGTTDTTGLPEGIYIVNNKKVFIK